MEQLFWISTALLGAAILLAMAERATSAALARHKAAQEWRRRCREQISQHKMRMLEWRIESSSPGTASERHGEADVPPPSPSPFRPAHWYQKIAIPPWFVGLVAVALVTPMIAFNADLVGLAFEVLNNQGGNPWWILTLFGQDVRVTDYYAYGLLFSLLLAFLAAAFWAARDLNETKSRARFIKGVSLFNVLVLVTLEVVLRAHVGWVVGGMWKALGHGLLALATAGAEVTAGILALHYCIIPLLLWVLSSIHYVLDWPFRAIAAHRERHRARAYPTIAMPTGASVTCVLDGSLAAVDRGLMEPLRVLDTCLGKLLCWLEKIFRRP